MLYIYIYIKPNKERKKNKTKAFLSSLLTVDEGEGRADPLEERRRSFLARKRARKLGEHLVSLSPLALLFVSFDFELETPREFDLTLLKPWWN